LIAKRLLRSSKSLHFTVIEPYFDATFGNYMAKKPIIPPMMPKKAVKPRLTLALALAAADAGPEGAAAFVGLVVAEFGEATEGVEVLATSVEDPAEDVAADVEEPAGVGTLLAAAVLGERT
jgi:hypothetical protein